MQCASSATNWLNDVTIIIKNWCHEEGHLILYDIEECDTELNTFHFNNKAVEFGSGKL